MLRLAIATLHPTQIREVVGRSLSKCELNPLALVVPWLLDRMKATGLVGGAIDQLLYVVAVLFVVAIEQVHCLIFNVARIVIPMSVPDAVQAERHKFIDIPVLYVRS